MKTREIKLEDIKKVYQTNKRVYIETEWIQYGTSEMLIKEIKINRKKLTNFENINLEIYKNFNTGSYNFKTFGNDGGLLKINTNCYQFKLIFKIDIPEKLVIDFDFNTAYTNPINKIEITYK